MKLGHIVVLTTGNDKIEGMVAGHAYSLLEAYECSTGMIFKSRNPWGKVEWSGQYGDKSSLWTDELKKKVNFTNNDNDGIFFLSESELGKVFVYYSVNEINNGSSYSFV